MRNKHAAFTLRPSLPPVNMRILAACVGVALLAGCWSSPKERWKNELVAADKAFNALSVKGGPKAAFLSVIARDAKLLGNASLGAEGVRNVFMELPDTVSLTWEPSFADVSDSGDLGYTWGRYTLTVPNPKPRIRPWVRTGYYVIVWRRTLGQWKVVLDGTSPEGPH